MYAFPLPLICSPDFYFLNFVKLKLFLKEIIGGGNRFLWWWALSYMLHSLLSQMSDLNKRMSAIERMLNRLEERMSVHSDEVTLPHCLRLLTREDNVLYTI